MMNPGELYPPPRLRSVGVVGYAVCVGMYTLFCIVFRDDDDMVLLAYCEYGSGLVETGADVEAWT